MIKIIIWENFQFKVYSNLINSIRLILFRLAFAVVVVSRQDYKFLKEKKLMLF
jgi:hypothetical protein